MFESTGKHHVQKQSMQEDVKSSDVLGLPKSSSQRNVHNPGILRKPCYTYMQLLKASRTGTLPTLITGTKNVIKNKATSTAQKLL